MTYIGRQKNRQLAVQGVGSLLMLFTIFIRYSSFKNSQNVNQGNWSPIANSLFNSVAHYLFIASLVLIFLPIFIGKLSIIRDIFASSFFRPFARISFSAMLLHGLMMWLVFFSTQQSVYYDHKNMIFIFFSLVFFTYVISMFVALFLEYPFRTMAKVVFSPPKKILRLNRELAKELNTNIDNIFNDTEDDYESSDNQVLPTAKFGDQSESINPHSKKKVMLDLTLPNRPQSARFNEPLETIRSRNESLLDEDNRS